MGGTLTKVTGEEGVLALWKGVNAAWLREASYTSLRLGLYEPVKVLVGANEANAPFYKKFLAGSAAGALGSLAGNVSSSMFLCCVVRHNRTIFFSRLSACSPSMY